MTVCGYKQGAQSNWLITQHINTTLDNGERLSQVTVQVNSIQSVCPTSQNGTNNCVNASVYETSSIDPAAAREPKNYLLVNSLKTLEAADEQEQAELLNVYLSTKESGLYLAIVESGTCIVISRLLVFYYVCPAETVNLVARPRTLAPPVGGTPLQVLTSCVENASPASGDTVILTCLSEGTWLDSASGCICNTGFVLSSGGQECLGKCHCHKFISQLTL